MVLELAERGGVYSYSPKRRRTMMKRPKPTVNPDGTLNYHIYIPKHLNDGYRGIYVREDKFDGLSESQFDNLMEAVIDYQPGFQEGPGLSSRDSRRKKKEFKQKKKEDRNTRKNSKREGKDYSKKTRANAKQTRADAKRDKAQGGGGRSAEDIFDTVVDKASGAYAKFKGGQQGGDDTGGDDSKSSNSSSGSDTIMGIPKTAAYAIGGVVGIGAIALAIHAMNKKAA